MKQNAPRTRLMIAGRDAVGVCLGAWHCPNFNHKRKQRTRAGQEPKSSPKHIAAKKSTVEPAPKAFLFRATTQNPRPNRQDTSQPPHLETLAPPRILDRKSTRLN